MNNLYTEDSTGGMRLLQWISEVYFNNSVNVITVNGISNLVEEKLNGKSKLDTLIESNEKCLIVVDRSTGNNDVGVYIDKILHKIIGTNIAIKLVESFEFEMLNTIGIELLTDKNIDTLYKYRKFVRDNNLDALTVDEFNTAFNNLDSKLYAKLYKNAEKDVNSLIKKGRIDIRDKDDCIKQRITLERFSKALYNDIFPYRKHRMDQIGQDGDTLGECFKYSCCKFIHKNCRLKYKCTLTPEMKLSIITTGSEYGKLVKILEKYFNVKANNIENVELSKLFNIKESEVIAESIRNQWKVEG